MSDLLSLTVTLLDSDEKEIKFTQDEKKIWQLVIENKINLCEKNKNCCSPRFWGNRKWEIGWGKCGRRMNWKRKWSRRGNKSKKKQKKKKKKTPVKKKIAKKSNKRKSKIQVGIIDYINK